MIVLSVGSLVAAEEKDPVTLDVWLYGDTYTESFDKVLQDLKADMLGKYNIALRYKWVDSQNLDEMWVTAAIARKGYDIGFEWEGATLTKRVASGNFMPLNEYFPQEEYGNYAGYDNLRFDGKLYAMPFCAFPGVVVYNKSLFRKAGLDPDAFPKTWDDFVATCEKLKAAGITPLAFGNKGGLANECIFADWAFECFDSGEEMRHIVSPEGTWVHPELIRFLHMYKQLYDKGYFQEDGMNLTFDEVYSGALVADKAAIGMYHSPPPYQALKAARGEDVAAMAPIPMWTENRLNDAVPVLYEVVGIAPWTKHAEEAATVVKEFLGAEYQTRLLLEADQLPTCPQVDVDLIEDPYIRDLVARIQRKAAPSWYGLYSHAEWQAHIRYISLFLLGEITAEEVLEQMDIAKGKV